MGQVLPLASLLPKDCPRIRNAHHSGRRAQKSSAIQFGKDSSICHAPQNVA
jgi:hypothetical protein